MYQCVFLNAAHENIILVKRFDLHFRFLTNLYSDLSPVSPSLFITQSYTWSNIFVSSLLRIPSAPSTLAEFVHTEFILTIVYWSAKRRIT